MGILEAIDKPMAHDVFISYSTEDKPIADAACAILEAQRIGCWIAPRDVQPGIFYPQSIMVGIRGSRVLVLILSAKSHTCKHVMREVERAVNWEIPVVPLRIEEVSLSGSMEYLVGSVHWIDALTPPMERHFETLARVVRALLTEFHGTETSDHPHHEEDVLPATPNVRPILSARSCRTPGACMICWGTSGNGALIGMMRSNTRPRRLPTHRARSGPRPESSGAVAGSAPRGAAGRRPATGACRGTGTASSASAWPQSRNDLGAQPSSAGRAGARWRSAVLSRISAALIR